MSNLSFKRDLNAETISQFGYVWVWILSKILAGYYEKWSHVGCI